MKFIDEAQITVAAGDGGDGCVAFLREKFRPLGGPAGGDGGDGGSVVLRADERLGSLLDFEYKRKVVAEKGAQGSGKNRHGAAAQDLIVPVPQGTVVYDAETGEQLADLKEAGSEYVPVYGGRGGRGNARFVSSTVQAPRRADPGEPGETRVIRLEIRLLADCGLVGLPNAGKSSLVSRVSAARPKVADYPFTTLVPALGVVRVGIDRTFVLADIPGLIEGAHEGVGLGIRFLKHLSRTSVLAHLVDSSLKSVDECLADYDTVNAELVSFDEGLATKPQVVVATKQDLTEVREVYPKLEAAFAQRGVVLHKVSSATGEGCGALMQILDRMLTEVHRAPDEERD